MRYSGSSGAWIKQRRKALDLTQDELAQRVGCAVTTIRRIEADVRRPSKQLAELLARHLNIVAEDRPDFIRFARNHLDSRAAEQPPQPGGRAVHATGYPHAHLPAPDAPLIGRAAEVAALRSFLLRHDVRLLTLVGPPGVGKTRLALHIAADLNDWFADGARFVALAPVRAPDLIAAAITQALGISQTGTQTLHDQINNWLHNRQLLLLLDNFEHLMACAPLVAEMLAAAPRLKIVVTSRALLHLAGEQEFTVPPLARPDPRALPALVALARYPAIELFVQRARAVRPDFMLTAANAADIAAICDHLDGLPLALELAATRVRLLAPSALRARIVEAQGHAALPLLRDGARDLPRQQTLRDAITWSYNLLQAHDQRLFRQIAVFVGSFALDAVEYVCDEAWLAGGDWNRQTSVLDGLATLLDQSLVQQVIGADGQPRFALLEILREYALERLEESGEAMALRRRHAAHYLALAEAASPELTRAQQATWLDRLEHEHANLRAALEWLLTQGNAELVLRLCTALWRFWDTRGHLSEGRRWFERALAQSATAPAPLRAQALNAAATLVSEQGDYTRAIALHQESMALKRALGDSAGVAGSLNNLVLIARNQGNFQQARAYGEESLALYRALGDKQGMSYALNNLGLAAGDQADYPMATTYHQESLALKWELGDKQGIASSLNNLGLVARLQDDYARAQMFYEEGLAMCREISAKAGIAIFLNNLGSLAISQQQYARAAVLCEESLALRRELGDRRGSASALQNLALAALAQGELARASVIGKEALALFHEVGGKAGIAGSLIILAMIAGAQGYPLHAARLYGTAEALNEAIGVSMSPAQRAEYDRRVAEARAQIDDLEFLAGWAQGRATPLYQAIAGALRGERVRDARSDAIVNVSPGD